MTKEPKGRTVITNNERRQIAKLLDIAVYPLSNDTYSSQYGLNRLISVRYFWIARFDSYYDLPWEGLMVCIVKDASQYYGLLMFSDDFKHSENRLHNPTLSVLPPRVMTTWDDPVAQNLRNLDIFVEEVNATVFANLTIEYDFMLSSRSLKTHIEVRTSANDRPGVDALTLNIFKVVQHLVDLYDDDYIRKVVLPDSDE